MKIHRLLLPFVVSASAALAQLATNPETTEGPYYPFNSSQTLDTAWLVGADNDLTLVTGKTTRASGTRFLLSGTVVNTTGTAVSGATIELWEADNNGFYYHSGNTYQNRDANFQSYGTSVTDSSGNWSFRTVRPGLYTGRIRHFHYKVRINGTAVLTSQFMFEEDRSQFASDNVAAPLVAAGTMDLAVLAPTTGIDPVDGASALIATKRIVIDPTAASANDNPSSGGGGMGTGPGGGTPPGGTGTGGTPPGTPGGTSPAVRTYALVNLSVRSTISTANSSITAGFVIQNGAKRILVRAVGPSLASYGVSGATSDPRIEIYNATGAITTSNDNWDGALAGTFAQVGAFPFTAGSRDAAIVADLPAGAGTAVLRANSAGVALLEAYDTSTTTAARVVNFSARGPVSASDPLIVGFVLQGTGTARFLVRAIGPGLANLGVNGAISDPQLQISNAAGTVVASNDNWDATLATPFTQAGAFTLASGSRDAAVVATLPAGTTYTVIARGVSGATGDVLVELYELQ